MTTQDPHDTIPETEETLIDTASDTVDTPPSSASTSSDEELIRLREALARSQADYQNLLMRVERDKTEMVSFLSGKILLPLLSQVDNLERAVQLKAEVEGDTFVDGVRAMHASMERYLDMQGVRPFVSVGQEVDPDRHDVMTEMVGEPGIIIQEFEKGYLIGERVLRHAKVVVGATL